MKGGYGETYVHDIFAVSLVLALYAEEHRIMREQTMKHEKWGIVDKDYCVFGCWERVSRNKLATSAFGGVI